MRRPEILHSMSSRKRDRDLNLQALEGLVVIFGPRQAARQARLNEDTVCSIAWRRGWKKTGPSLAKPVPTAGHDSALTPSQETQAICKQATPQAIASALQSMRSRSTLALASYLADTAEALAEAEDKLGMTRRAKDLGDLHGRLYPPDQNAQPILQVAILTGQRAPRRIRQVDGNSEACN
jgi:hypothetical protein